MNKIWTEQEYLAAEVELAGYEGWKYVENGAGPMIDPCGITRPGPPPYCHDINVARELIGRYQLMIEDGDPDCLFVHWPDGIQGQAHDVHEHCSREIAMSFALTQAAIAYHKQCLEQINENGNSQP